MNKPLKMCFGLVLFAFMSSCIAGNPQDGSSKNDTIKSDTIKNDISQKALIPKELAPKELTEKEIVRQSFLDWEKGKGSPFSLLSENATWTVMGPTSSAKTYTIKELQQQIITPFNLRLKTPLRPTLIDIFQEDDTVIILFNAQATMINGDIYKNSYAWFFTMSGKVVTNVKAVLDLNAFDRLMALNLPEKPQQ
ncbi:hypothetical protein TDB9533_00740 [Thalassocella blandensis]|nr:hypothetical protein TDB9533_00740 [Thalassocella blandensis]